MKGTPPGDALLPLPQRAAPAQRGAHAVGPVLGPHARTNRTRDTRVEETRLPAPGDKRRREGQRLTPDAPHNSGRPSPPGTAPQPPCGAQPPQGMQAKGQCRSPEPAQPHPRHSGGTRQPARRAGSRGGGVPDLRRPSRRRTVPPPPGTPLRHPHSAQRRPARAHAMGPVLGPHARNNRTRDTRAAESRLPAPEDGQLRKGQRLTPGAPTGHTRHGDSAGPDTRTPVPTARGKRAPAAPRRRAARRGRAPSLGRPSQRGHHGRQGGGT